MFSEVVELPVVSGVLVFLRRCLIVRVAVGAVAL